MDNRRQVGVDGEDRAAEYLRREGYKIVERNWRTTLGELDIVASLGKELVFVEVRTLAGPNLLFPEESVGAGKQRRLARLATAYVKQARYEGDWRIDVIAIDRDGLRHIENAVSLW
ncbi:MAG TPA: YraN family protein [Chloroflexota bacterium]|nr:YraN family protein [Chloroflexota bacterium]